MPECKIAFFELEEPYKTYLVDGCINEGELITIQEPLDSSNVKFARDCEILSIFIYSQITSKILQCLPNLKFITTRSTGFDHIDLKACAEKGIVVSNVPRYGENTVAEHAFGLILSLTRKIHQAYLKTEKMDFSIKGLKGWDLKGKTIGVVGAGRIGLHVIRIAKGFGMNVLAYDAFEQDLLAEVLGFKYVSFDELLSSSDIITLHAPLIPSTYHMINRKNIKKIKRGAILINTARGGLVDTAAIVEALDEGILSGAGLDVLEGEEAIKEEAELLSEKAPVSKLRAAVKSFALLRHENVIVTPHVAFYSEEAERRILDTTIQNICAYKAGNPQNIVKY